MTIRPIERAFKGDRIRHGFQLIQTDYPWHFIHDDGPPDTGIPTDPSGRLRDAGWLTGDSHAWSSWSRRERGGKIYFHTQLPTEVFVFETLPAVSQQWLETMVSTTRVGDTWTTRIDDLPTPPHWPNLASFRDVPLSCPRRAQEGGVGRIVATSESGNDALVITRFKTTEPGVSYYQESVRVVYQIYHNGQLTVDIGQAAP
jgi:hypothetical protein